MALELTRRESAAQLPDLWDELAPQYFSTREFLLHTEKYNPCRQRYYELSEGGRLRVGAVVYSFPVDLFSFLAIRSPVPMTVVGVPCSVASNGIVGDEGLIQELLPRIRAQERDTGILLTLNLKPGTSVGDMVAGRVPPNILFDNRFASWEDYLAGLRADYRRRLKLVTTAFEGARIETGACSRFDSRMHELYLRVLKRSAAALETLSLPFFQNLPPRFRLTTYTHAGQLIGWHTSVFDRGTDYFFFCGFDERSNESHNTYFNILVGVLREGMADKAKLIDLGQTAEIPKLRLGGRVLEMGMLGHHPSRFVRFLFDAGRPILQYRRRFPDANVFK